MSLTARTVFLLCLLPACLPPAQADQQADLERLRDRITALQKDMDKTGDSRSESADALRESERAISNSQRALHRIEASLRNTSQELARLKQQSATINSEIQQQQILLAKLLQQQYINGGNEYFRLLLDNKDPNQTARNLQYYEYIAKTRAAWLNHMRNSVMQLNQSTLQLQKKNAEQAALKHEQAAQILALQKEKNSRKQVLAVISQQLRQQRREMGKLQRDESRLSRLVGKLAHIVTEPRQPGKPADGFTPTLNSKAGAFVSLQGKLPLPVKGRITNHFGNKRPDSPVLWKGLFLQAAASQPVNAVASGRVIYSDWLRGFGNLLIIDHGSGYMSLYGNNEAVYKQVGDAISAGEVIASVGNSGGNDNYGLYFELRHEGIPLDPEKWISRKSTRKR